MGVCGNSVDMLEAVCMTDSSSGDYLLHTYVTCSSCRPTLESNKTQIYHDFVFILPDLLLYVLVSMFTTVWTLVTLKVRIWVQFMGVVLYYSPSDYLD